MLAFFNDQALKQKYIDRVKWHREQDNLVQGIGWEDGKGCAVGCTLENYNHHQYEIELGIPEWLAKLEDTIFEGLETSRAMSWPQEFLEAIPPGVDLNQAKTPFIVFVLNSTIESMDRCEFDRDKNPDVVKVIEGSKAAVLEMIKCHQAGASLSAAWSAAWSARSAAESAARSAAESAARSAARSAAESAAWSAAESARSAAWSAARSAAWSAVESAAWSARSAAWSARSAEQSAAWSAESAERSAESAERSAEHVKFADKLLEILKECK